MSNVKIIVTPTGIKSAISKTTTYLEKADYDLLFLNLSKKLEEGVRELAEGAPYNMILDWFMEENLIQEPLGVFKSEAEPLLKAIRGITLRKPNLEIHCYKDPSSINQSIRLATEVMLKIFKWSSTGKVDLEEWKKLVYSWLRMEDKALNRESDYIMKETDKAEDSLCLAGFDGRQIKKRLKERGCNVDLKYAYLPYHFTPLEILVREIRFGDRRKYSFMRERMKDLIEQHGRFIRDYVISSRDYDEAYRRWIIDNIPWIKHRFLRYLN